VFLRILGFHERIPKKAELIPLVFTNCSVIYSDAALSLLRQPASQPASQPTRDFPRKRLKWALVGNTKEEMLSSVRLDTTQAGRQ
jgi:hypothetical protein